MWIQYWNALQLVAVVIVGGCFILSGLAKLRDHGAISATFDALGLPLLLHRRWIYLSYPWLELLIGAGVLFAPPYLWWLSALAAAMMLAILTALVWSVVARAKNASCNCFGSVQKITGFTLARNIIFLAFAILLILNSPNTPAPLLAAIPAEFPLALAVTLSAASGTLLTVLSKAAPTKLPGAAKRKNEKRRVPSLMMATSDGEEVFLPNLISKAPTLLVHVKEGCASCNETIAHFNNRTTIADRVAIQIVERTPITGPDSTRARLWDYGDELRDELGITRSPSAVLVAADGWIATAPVTGLEAIRELVGGIEAAVASTAN